MGLAAVGWEAKAAVGSAGGWAAVGSAEGSASAVSAAEGSALVGVDSAAGHEA